MHGQKPGSSFVASFNVHREYHEALQYDEALVSDCSSCNCPAYRGFLACLSIEMAVLRPVKHTDFLMYCRWERMCQNYLGSTDTR